MHTNNNLLNPFVVCKTQQSSPLAIAGSTTVVIFNCNVSVLSLAKYLSFIAVTMSSRDQYEIKGLFKVS